MLSASVIGLKFQSTQPKRAATYTPNMPTKIGTLFQSTQPKRAATEVQPLAVLADKGISIHAAQEGCDQLATARANDINNFNPRSPRGLRQIKVCLFLM